jgi:predicted ABC-type ATPase
MDRPVLFVLAGVNGAGKSSVGGHLLQQAGLPWFNPDTFARELLATTDCGQTQANATAWREGLRRLDEALINGHNFAFETTLGGNTIAARIAAAARTHDVLLWYCGLASPALHIARVQARVAAGGHDIPEAKIRERWQTSLQNLIALLPHLAQLQVYDNSAQAQAGEVVPDPLLIAEMRAGKLTWPTSLDTLRATPSWGKPLLEAALSTRS